MNLINSRIWVFILMLSSTLCVTTAFAKTHTVEQLNKSFVIDDKKASNIVIKVGDTIKFKNVDTVFHNIFSMSKLMSFNLGAFSYGESESVDFEKVGEVPVACAIHPRMVIKVIVTR